ncbi:MAG: hypothetical protein C5B49_02820 [Bdellovibrio sp.]|nr:MAG: hypothetical protein C5B49_02820 [Bdellovibrio sp.]
MGLLQNVWVKIEGFFLKSICSSGFWTVDMASETVFLGDLEDHPRKRSGWPVTPSFTEFSENLSTRFGEDPKMLASMKVIDIGP